MSDKAKARARRARKTRAKINAGLHAKLTIVRSNKHIRAQVIDVLSKGGHKVLAAANSLEKAFKDEKGKTKIDLAKLVGKNIGKRAKDAGVTKVAFDRSGFKYHGRVKALAEAAREEGIEI